MEEPVPSRPHMPGYGLQPSTEGTGLLPWSWAQERLAASQDYWVATAWPDGRPHLMPVWGMWHDTALWFSCSGRSRKTMNLKADPRCSISTDNPLQPVVVEGIAELVTDMETLALVIDLENAKYSTSYGIELLDPAVSACFRVSPIWAFGIAEGDFTGSPTRWTFPPHDA
jgi:pyridoxamine 5'-phosphate oxidase-like protein